jgi:hypothetical protein
VDQSSTTDRPIDGGKQTGKTAVLHLFEKLFSTFFKPLISNKPLEAPDLTTTDYYSPSSPCQQKRTSYLWCS